MLKAKKSIMSIIVAILSSFMLFFVSMPEPISTSAATKSSGTKTQIITVVTKADWLKWGAESITLTQTAGKAQAWNYLWTGKTKSAYATWKITIRSTDGKHKDTQYLTGATKTVKLKPNKTYKITVEWSDYINWDKGFVSNPSWRVSKTNKVVKCY